MRIANDIPDDMSQSPRRSVILFAHGARDAGWSRPLAALQQRLSARLPDADVTIAFLELQTPTLADVLEAAARSGAQHVTIVPVFWASGGHVTNDLPPLIDAFRRTHAAVQVTVLPVLSELPGLLDFVADAVARARLP